MPTQDRALVVTDVGRIAYGAALDLQSRLVSERQAGRIDDQLLLLEHPPVITYGRRAGTAHLLASATELRRHGVELCATDRGGDITYHGPGQLIGYLIAALDGVERQVPRLFARLESAIVAVLENHGLRAAGGTQAQLDGQQTDLTHAGVWVGRAKICALGMRIAHGVTKHGFALNVEPELGHFRLIVPCGLQGLGVTSMRELLGCSVPMALLKPHVAHAVAHQLGRRLILASSQGLTARPDGPYKPTFS